MNPIYGHIQGAALVQRFRQDAESDPRIAPAPASAPRRRAGHLAIARALRSLALRLSAYAERLEPTPAPTVRRGRAIRRPVH